jgi:hypothetical protein
MKDFIKAVYLAGEYQGRANEASDYFLKDTPEPDETLRLWLKGRLDRCLPCDRDIRKNLEKLLDELSS